MCKKYFLIKMTMVAIALNLAMQQMKFTATIVEAKEYSQPYGDIMQEEDDNTFDVKNKGDHYGHRNRQPQLGNSHQKTNSLGGKYPNEYATTASGWRRGEREKSQYRNLDQRNNRNSVRNNPNGWMASSSIVEEQFDKIAEDISEDAGDHKCNIWVPLDALYKYPDAEKKQDNKIAGSVYIEICCQGYAAMRWRGKTLCRPVCDNCQNGRCIAPGVCECYDEYVANDNGDCVFGCPIACLNGRCYLDGSCQCDPGYKLDESRKFCRPICSKGCGTNRLHNCTEPEVCGCIKGYILTDNDCQPVCQHDCGSGGICRQPNTCDCSPGYDLKDGVCQADCYQKCDNGICFSRNRCICNPGFTYHERSTQCIPK